MTGGGYSRIAAASTKARFNNKPKGGARYAAAAAGASDLNGGFFAAMAAAFAGSISRMGRTRSRPARHHPLRAQRWG